MQSHMSMKVRRTAARACCSVLALTVGCGGQGGPGRTPSRRRVASVQTQPLESDPCAWVTPERWSLVGKPRRAQPPRKSGGTRVSHESGKACVYDLAGAGPTT